MRRIDLFVSPEDYARVQALGACWDGRAMCWYIDGTATAERFAAWLPDAGAADASEEEFLIGSSEACVARARTRCRHCHSDIEVVCLYCRNATVCGEPLEAFRVQGVWTTDDALRRQLLRWPHYRFDDAEGTYLNYCPHCGGAQEEADLHEEPGQPFHDLCRDVPDGVQLEPLQGHVQLSGDYCADV